MLETLVGLVFLFALWVLGRGVIMACNASDFDWLAMPLGLCVVGLTGNALYFAAGLSIQSIQLVFLFALLACFALILYQRIERGEWLRLLGVCGIFFVLALPAYLGGEQYYVFQGNHWDHLNYINQALALGANPYSTYQNALATDFLAKDLLVHALPLLSLRPAVGLLFAVLLPAGKGNIHLLAFLYVTALWALTFPAACFAWERILKGDGERAKGPSLLLAPPLAYVLGFWGQYIFDINSWSQMSSLSLLLALVFAYAHMLQQLTDPLAPKAQNLMPAFVLTALLSAGAFLFYPENTSVHALLILLATVLWCVVKRIIPRFTVFATLGILIVSALLLSSLPHWEGTVGFLQIQTDWAATARPNWWQYFDRYWLGLHERVFPPIKDIWRDIWAVQDLARHQYRPLPSIADVAATPSLILSVATPSLILSVVVSVVPNLILSLVGMFFVTPDYDAPLVMRYGWMALTIILALVILYSLANTLIICFRSNEATIFVKTFVLFGILLLFYFLANRAFWSLGKALSFISPYLCIVIFLPLIEKTRTYVNPRNGSIMFVNVMMRGVAMVFIASQIGFGMARLWAARDPNGIGYSNATYPSIQGIHMKADYLWDMDPGALAGCKGVHLHNDKNPFYMEYMKQKLAYVGVPYFTEQPVESNYFPGSGQRIGKAPIIPIDCNAVFMQGASGKWHVEYDRQLRKSGAAQ